MIKIHKSKGGTCLVCSNCASLVHPLGKWLELDYTLQPIVTSQPFYFKDSFVHKQELYKLVLHPNASIISFNAIAMFTNIDINDSIKQISTFLAKTWDNYDYKAVKKAMEIVMNNNRMKFGNLVYHQTCGVAMGMLPTPTITNLYVAIYERDHIIPLIGVEYLMFYKRFIDDEFAVWLHNKDPTTDTNIWNDFKDCLNAMGLSWTFILPSKLKEISQ
jgi:hypothetical protein